MLKGLSLPFVISGLVLLLFGLIAVTAPNMTVPVLMLYLAYMLAVVGGISIFIGIVMRKSSKNWWATMLMGILIMAIAVTIFIKDDGAARYFTLSIASFAALMGLALIGASYYQKQLKIVLIVNGLMSVAFGLVIYSNTSSGAINLNFMVGFYTILLSIMLIYVAYRLSKGKKNAEDQTTIV